MSTPNQPPRPKCGIRKGRCGQSGPQAAFRRPTARRAALRPEIGPYGQLHSPQATPMQDNSPRSVSGARGGSPYDEHPQICTHAANAA